MTVDPLTGIIWVVFYDRRNTAGNETDVYVARSEDGGETFVNFPVSDSTFIPQTTVFFGDYINIAARGGKVYPIWARMDRRVLTVWVALIDESVGVEEIPSGNLPDGFVLSQNYPNPFNASTSLSFQLPRPEMVDLSIYNIRGQLMTTLVNGWRGAGPHTVPWRAGDLGSGIYVYQLTAGGQRAAGKCLLLR